MVSIPAEENPTFFCFKFNATHVTAWLWPVFDTVDGRNPGKVEACKTLEIMGLWDDCLSSINPSTFPKANMSLATKPSQKERKIFQPSIFNRYLTFKEVVVRLLSFWEGLFFRVKLLVWRRVSCTFLVIGRVFLMANQPTPPLGCNLLMTDQNGWLILLSDHENWLFPKLNIQMFMDPMG